MPARLTITFPHPTRNKIVGADGWATFRCKMRTSLRTGTLRNSVSLSGGRHCAFVSREHWPRNVSTCRGIHSFTLTRPTIKSGSKRRWCFESSHKGRQSVWNKSLKVRKYHRRTTEHGYPKCLRSRPLPSRPGSCRRGEHGRRCRHIIIHLDKR
jgi:hypothetical protein